MECRICFGDERPETMLIPCRCRGTSAYVHDACLRTYFSYYPDRICRVCHERMGHPWIDTERNLICGALLLVWSAILLVLSTVSATSKGIVFLGLTGLLLHHIRRKQLTYETTIAILAISGLLFLTEPQHLPQTVFLAAVVLVLLTLCLFVPVETVFLILVFCLAMTYSVLFLFMVAVRTDPAFTGLLLLVVAIFWMVFLRPRAANEVFP